MSKSQVRKKDALAQALLTLLHHEAVEKITVDQLCREADLHRSTFYRYFKINTIYCIMFFKRSG